MLAPGRDLGLVPVIASALAGDNRHWRVLRNCLILGSRRAGGGAMTIAVEEKRLRRLFERVEGVEDVARTAPEDDERRAQPPAGAHNALAGEGHTRPSPRA